MRELCRSMSRPLVGDWARLKKLARCLLCALELAIEYRLAESMHGREVVCTGSDSGSCRETRRSRSGLAFGSCCTIRCGNGFTWRFAPARRRLVPPSPEKGEGVLMKGEIRDVWLRESVAAGESFFCRCPGIRV